MRHILVALFFLSLARGYAQAPTGSDIQMGKDIWQGYFGLQNDCKLCHGDHGEGGFAKALAGHQLTSAQFLRAVRQGPGLMPSFVPDKNLNDQQVAQVAAYLASLPKATGPASAWHTRVPALATAKQKLNISTGCGQCHGPVMANPRRTAGGVGADFAWFKQEVYEHTTAPLNVNRPHLRMGNYSKQQVSEETLQELWQFFAVEQGLRVPVSAQVSAGVPSANGVTYTITLQNSGTPGKGLPAEHLTITLPLLRGRDPEEVTTLIEATTGGGYTGVHRDLLTNSNAGEFEIPILAPGEKRIFTITLSGQGANVGIPRGTVKWEKPRLNSGGADLISIAVPPGQ